MAEIRPLRGVRFQPRVSGPVGSLIAPPYDAATAAGNGSEFSISRIENADLSAPGDQHAIAARRYRDWLARGVLVQDREPALYVHRHRFASDGVQVSRTGLLARVRLADWDERIVLPHERTTPGPREERLGRLRATGANLSPLYFLYRDLGAEVRQAIDLPHTSEAAGYQDRMGGEHWLGRIVDLARQERIVELFRQRTLFVADGHHRYEAALGYRNACRQRQPGVDGPWNYVLALLSPVEDPGVIVRPTHRVLAANMGQTADALLGLLRRWFEVREAREPYFSNAEGGLFRVVLPGGAWDAFSLPNAPHLALLPRERSAAWKTLSVSVLQEVLNSFLGGSEITSDSAVAPAVDAAEVMRRVRTGESSAALLLPPPALDSLLAVAESGDLLPPKSTWFEPKAPAGLVINDLRSL